MAHTLPSDLIDSCDGGLVCISQYANDVTNGFFYPGLLIAFSIVLFIATQRFGTARAFGSASVFSMLGALFLAIAGLLPWWIASIFLLTGALGFVVMIMNEK